MMNPQPPPYSSTAVPVVMPVTQPTAPVIYQPASNQWQQQSTTTVVLGNAGQTGSNIEDVIGCPTFR